VPRNNRPRRNGRPPRAGGATRRDGAGEPDDGGGLEAPAARTVEQHPDGQWVVQHLTAPSATKAYRCPGCNHEVPVGAAHLVAWRADGPLAGLGGVDERRHWHIPCWRARARRGR